MAPNTKPTKSSQQTVVNDSTKDNVGNRSRQRVTRPTKTTAAKTSKAGKGRGTGVVVKATIASKTEGDRSHRTFMLQRGPPVACCNPRKVTLHWTLKGMKPKLPLQARQESGASWIYLRLCGWASFTYHSDVDGDCLNVNRQQSHWLATMTLGMVVGCKPWGLWRIVNVAIPPVDSGSSFYINVNPRARGIWY